jgi:tetratricopeptide (TPR) repeat protein
VLIVLLAAALAACSSPEEKAAGHVAKAQQLLEAKDFDKAKLEARSAVQIQPKNADAQLILAKIAWASGDYRQAFPHLQMAVEGNPALTEARLRLADLYLSAGDVNSASEQLTAIREADPDSAETHLLAGRVLIAQNDRAAGDAEIDKALAANPALIGAINVKASLLSAQGRNEEALAVMDAGVSNTEGAERVTMREFRLGFLFATGQLEAYEKGLGELIAENPDKLSYRYQLLDFYARQERTDDEERALRELVELDKDNPAVKTRLANFLINRDDKAGAEKLLKDSIAADPDNAELRIALGDYYRFTDRSAEAMSAYREVAAKWAATTAEGQLARNRVAAQLTRDGNIEQARADVEALLAEAPDNPDARLARATFLFLDRNYEDAIADLRTVLRRQKSAEALLLLARSYVGVGDLVVAKDTYRRLLADYPNQAEASKELAVLLSEQGDAAAAAEILRRFVAVRPNDTEASAALVQTLLAQRDVEAAEAEARRMVEQGVGGLSAEQQFGAVLQARGSNEQALARYRAVLDKDPNQAQALEGLVSVLLDLGRGGEAITYLERYPKGDVTASVLLGKVYARQGDIAAARQVIEQAIAAHPDDGRPYLALAALAPPDTDEQLAVLERGWKGAAGDPILGLFLGSLHNRRGQIEEAIAVYDEVVRQGRGSPAVVNNLAALLLDHRDDKESLARALELAKSLGNTGDAVILDTLGWAYYRNADFPNAVRQLERAVAANDADPVLQYHLGMAYAAAGNRVSAKQHLEGALARGGADARLVADAKAALAKLGE